MTERLPRFHLLLLGKELAALTQFVMVKDLGVTFHKNLTFDNHVVNRVSFRMLALYKDRHAV